MPTAMNIYTVNTTFFIHGLGIWMPPGGKIYDSSTSSRLQLKYTPAGQAEDIWVEVPNPDTINFPAGTTWAALLASAVVSALPPGFEDETGELEVEGPQGPQGFRGFQGLQGPQGNQGVQGTKGFQGFMGAQGDQGDQGFQGNQGFQGEGVQGDQGVQGSIGSAGESGGPGAQGPQGFQGDIGADGLQGVDGTQGFQGFQGEEGIQGDDTEDYVPGAEANWQDADPSTFTAALDRLAAAVASGATGPIA